MSRFVLVLVALALGVSASGFTAARAVTPGLDVLREDGSLLAGKRIGLIANPTAVALDGTPALSILRDELHLDVVALFSPEHGYTGDVAAGDAVDSGRELVSALPVFSLYGETREPTPEMLAGIEVLVFDIQDIGVRFYTYISTMKHAMEAAARAGVAFVVLDRPNPNGGARVEGPMLDPEFGSFVGATGIPVMHGMTVGELARWFRATMPSGESLELDVVPVRGLTRSMMWAETGLAWRLPSPNIRSVGAALAFPAMGLFEGIDVSEGRGIDETFERVGAPWIDAETLAITLNGRSLPGVRFEPVSFVPRVTAAAPRPKYPDETCHGVALVIFDPSRFEAVRTGLTAIAAIRRLWPEKFSWIRQTDRFWIDTLLGTDRPRRAMESGRTVDEILAVESAAVEAFRHARTPYLIY